MTHFLRSQRPLRAALVGPGYIAGVHADCLRRMGVEAVAMVGRDRERTRNAADQLGIPQAATSLDKVLADPSVDVIHVCTPNYLHHAMALAVLKSGKHLVCEKPLTTTSRDSAELMAAAGPGQIAAVAYCYRYYPLAQELRSMISAGDLGNVHHISGAYLTDELSEPSDFSWVAVPDFGGPSFAMMDIGIHWCDLAEHVTGEHIVELLSDFQTVVPERIWRPDAPGHGPAPSGSRAVPGDVARLYPVPGEDSLCLLVRFSGGARGSVHISKVSLGRKNWIQLDVEGTQAAAAWNQEQPNTLEIRRRSMGSVQHRDPTRMSDQARTVSSLPPGHPEGYHDAFFHLLRGAYADVLRSLHGEALAGGYPTLADGHRSMLIAEAALQSARTGRWSKVGG